MPDGNIQDLLRQLENEIGGSADREVDAEVAALNEQIRKQNEANNNFGVQSTDNPANTFDYDNRYGALDSPVNYNQSRIHPDTYFQPATRDISVQRSVGLSQGFTGSMAPHQIAGVVHGGEFVMNANATRLHLPLLHQMNSGQHSLGNLPGFQSGGLPGMADAQSLMERLSREAMRLDDASSLLGIRSNRPLEATAFGHIQNNAQNFYDTSIGNLYDAQQSGNTSDIERLVQEIMQARRAKGTSKKTTGSMSQADVELNKRNSLLSLMALQEDTESGAFPGENLIPTNFITKHGPDAQGVREMDLRARFTPKALDQYAVRMGMKLPSDAGIRVMVGDPNQTGPDPAGGSVSTGVAAPPAGSSPSAANSGGGIQYGPFDLDPFLTNKAERLREGLGLGDAQTENLKKFMFPGATTIGSIGFQGSGIKEEQFAPYNGIQKSLTRYIGSSRGEQADYQRDITYSRTSGMRKAVTDGQLPEDYGELMVADSEQAGDMFGQFVQRAGNIGGFEELAKRRKRLMEVMGNEDATPVELRSADRRFKKEIGRTRKQNAGDENALSLIDEVERRNSFNLSALTDSGAADSDKTSAVRMDPELRKIVGRVDRFDNARQGAGALQSFANDPNNSTNMREQAQLEAMNKMVKLLDDLVYLGKDKERLTQMANDASNPNAGVARSALGRLDDATDGADGEIGNALAGKRFHTGASKFTGGVSRVIGQIPLVGQPLANMLNPAMQRGVAAGTSAAMSGGNSAASTAAGLGGAGMGGAAAAALGAVAAAGLIGYAGYALSGESREEEIGYGETGARLGINGRLLNSARRGVNGSGALSGDILRSGYQSKDFLGVANTMGLVGLQGEGQLATGANALNIARQYGIDPNQVGSVGNALFRSGERSDVGGVNADLNKFTAAVEKGVKAGVSGNEMAGLLSSAVEKASSGAFLSKDAKDGIFAQVQGAQGFEATKGARGADILGRMNEASKSAAPAAISRMVQQVKSQGLTGKDFFPDDAAGAAAFDDDAKTSTGLAVANAGQLDSRLYKKMYGEGVQYMSGNDKLLQNMAMQTQLGLTPQMAAAMNREKFASGTNPAFSLLNPGLTASQKADPRSGSQRSNFAFDSALAQNSGFAETGIGFSRVVGTATEPLSVGTAQAGVGLTSIANSGTSGIGQINSALKGNQGQSPTSLMAGDLPSRQNQIPIGKASGGFAGGSDVASPAGVFHDGEWVINAQASKKNMNLLNTVNNGGDPSTQLAAGLIKLSSSIDELNANMQRSKIGGMIGSASGLNYGGRNMPQAQSKPWWEQAADGLSSAVGGLFGGGMPEVPPVNIPGGAGLPDGNNFNIAPASTVGGNQFVADMARKAENAPGFETVANYCSRWVKQVFMKAYPKAAGNMDAKLFGSTAKQSAQMWRNQGLSIAYNGDPTSLEAGDALFRESGDGGAGHTGIYGGDGYVYENTTRGLKRDANGKLIPGQDARTRTAIKDWGKIDSVGRLSLDRNGDLKYDDKDRALAAQGKASTWLGGTATLNVNIKASGPITDAQAAKIAAGAAKAVRTPSNKPPAGTTNKRPG